MVGEFCFIVPGGLRCGTGGQGSMLSAADMPDRHPSRRIRQYV